MVRRVGAAQQPERAAPHTGVPEIGATLSGCYADAVGVCNKLFEFRKPIDKGGNGVVQRMQ